MNQTDTILFNAEQEYGQDLMNQCRLCGRFQSECACLDLDLDGSIYIPVDDLVEEEVEEDCIDIVQETTFNTPYATLPEGWLFWMDCNSPGSVFMGSKENYDYHDINGYMPVEISYKAALHYLNNGDGDGPWNLYVSSPLSNVEREEIKKFNEMWRNK